MDSFKVDEETKQLYINGRRVWPSPIEWEIFMALYRSDLWMPSKQIELHVPSSNAESPGEIKWHISNLRQKIKPLKIIFRRGFGYMLEIPETKLVM